MRLSLILFILFTIITVAVSTSLSIICHTNEYIYDHTFETQQELDSFCESLNSNACIDWWGWDKLEYPDNEDKCDCYLNTDDCYKTNQIEATVRIKMLREQPSPYGREDKGGMYVPIIFVSFIGWGITSLIIFAVDNRGLE